MKKLLLVLVLLASATLFGQSPFDGTWMTKLDTAKFPTKPDKYSLHNNMYECLTCVPSVAVKADGTEQKVTGHPYYDTIAVHVVNASSVEDASERKTGRSWVPPRRPSRPTEILLAPSSRIQPEPSQ